MNLKMELKSFVIILDGCFIPLTVSLKMSWPFAYEIWYIVPPQNRCYCYHFEDNVDSMFFKGLARSM